MIYVKDKGRLCNNILQFGHAYAWARENGLRAVSLRFAYKYRGFRICGTRGHNFLNYLQAKYRAHLGLIPEVSIDSPDLPAEQLDVLYDRVRRNARRGVVLSGWWVRHYDLFLKYRDEITSLFAFTGSDTGQLPAAEPGTVWLGVHVRRGDYSRWHGGRYFYSDGQYVACINSFIDLMKLNSKRVNVAVFTNDPKLDTDYFIRNLHRDAAELVFPFGTAVSDLQTLSACDYIMGPPSTFSLTAAMFRDRPVYFIQNPEKSLTFDDFSDFATLFRYNY